MNNLLDVILLLTVAVLAVPLFQFLRLGAVLGFIAAGALIGPSGLGLIAHVESLRHFSELGVVFLLFIIGVELKPSRLWLMRRAVFGLGTLQVVATGAALVPLALFAGFHAGAAVLVGAGLALSSTAFVLQLLVDRHELGTAVGRSAFAILLLQDLAVVPLMALVPLLAQPDTSLGRDLGLALMQSAAILAAVFVAGRFLLRPVLHLIARHGTSEVFAASGLLLVLGTGVLLEQVGLSMAMGAFMAGLLIADSEFRHQIHADIQPFRGLLLGLFFMAVGMSVELDTLLTQPLRFVAAVLVLAVVKGTVMLVLARLFGLATHAAARTGIYLAQGGEFAFVLFGAAAAAGLISRQQFGELVMVVALSMAFTPLFAALADRLRPRTGDGTPAPAAEEHEAPRIIVAGFGRVGRRIMRVLDHAGLPCAAVERDPDKVHAGRREGLKVYYGDASRHDVLRAVGADEARLVLVTLDSAEATERLVAAMHDQYPHLPIYARGRDSDVCLRLAALGASEVVSENLEASLQLARLALDRCGMDSARRDHLLDSYRQEYYRGQPAEVNPAAAAPAPIEAPP